MSTVRDSPVSPREKQCISGESNSDFFGKVDVFASQIPLIYQTINRIFTFGMLHTLNILEI